MKVKYRVSFVQLLFLEVEETKNFNTTDMHHYLETKHLEDYKELEAKEKQIVQERT